MANIIQATTFRGLFDNMGDIYGGVYHPFLTEYRPNNRVNSLELMRRTLTLPTDQVPAVFIYQGFFATLRIVHHINQVDTPFGQPPNPLSQAYLAFTGEVFQGGAQMVQLTPETFFGSTGNVTVPTIATMTAMLADAQNGMIGPLLPDAPNTEIIITRRAVPVPFAYVPLVAFRNLSPAEAWQQVGEQIILDGRQEDCILLLNFLRAATVVAGGGPRNVPEGPPILTQPTVPVQPLDGPILQHTNRKLHQLLPAIFLQAPPADHQANHATMLMHRTLVEGLDAFRADRAQAHEAAAAKKTFTEIFPATAVGIRRLCLAGDDDDLLPEFWKFWAGEKGKKAPGLQAFSSLVAKRASSPESSEVMPVISTVLWVNISGFELGASDLEVITQGVSPFLMCPRASLKAHATNVLTQQYLLLQGDNSLPLLSDVQQLVPSNSYTIPEDLHLLTAFIGAYSVIWDVLIGTQHPLSTALLAHYKFWNKNIQSIITAIPEPYMRNVVIVGTLRYIQLNVLRYVNEVMFTENDFIIPPSFDYIETSLHNRLFQQLPALPAAYHRAVRNVDTSTPAQSQNRITRPTNTSTQVSKEVFAPDQDKILAHIDAFSKSPKTVPQLRNLQNLPKTQNGTSLLCLSYHLRGQCFEQCKKIGTHRKLLKSEAESMAAFVRDHL